MIYHEYTGIHRLTTDEFLYTCITREPRNFKSSFSRVSMSVPPRTNETPEGQPFTKDKDLHLLCFTV